MKTNKIKKYYQQLYSLTEPVCRTQCKLPQSCCSPEYCHMTIQYAREEYNITLQSTEHPSLPLMGTHGCTAEPYLRPMCTRHVCSIHAFGISGDKQFDKKYFGLLDKIDKIELQRYKEKSNG